jgi:hypothetical protein
MHVSITKQFFISFSIGKWAQNLLKHYQNRNRLPN